MNDFTKEELKSIYLDMNYNILKAGKNNVDQFYLKLRDKVEAMINNFCEHTYVFRCHDDTIYCPKCGELLQ